LKHYNMINESTKLIWQYFNIKGEIKMFLFTIVCLIISALLTLGALLNDKTGMRFISLMFHLPLLVFFILTFIKHF
jgi:fumarate reductase subunit D